MEIYTKRNSIKCDAIWLTFPNKLIIPTDSFCPNTEYENNTFSKCFYPMRESNRKGVSAMANKKHIPIFDYMAGWRHRCGWISDILLTKEEGRKMADEHRYSPKENGHVTSGTTLFGALCNVSAKLNVTSAQCIAFHQTWSKRQAISLRYYYSLVRCRLDR